MDQPRTQTRAPREDGAAVAGAQAGDRRDRVLRVLAAATFLIIFQAFMVAPLLPRLTDLFGVSVGAMGLVVPAYLLPYGAATLVLDPNKGQAMGLNVFTLFTGFGLGSLLFSGALRLGLGRALVIFGTAAFLAAALAVPLFRAEGRPGGAPRSPRASAAR